MKKNMNKKNDNNEIIFVKTKKQTNKERKRNWYHLPLRRLPRPVSDSRHDTQRAPRLIYFAGLNR